MFRAVALALIVACVAVCLGSPAHAWSCPGHALVVAVAQQWLLTNVRTKQFRTIVHSYYTNVAERALAYDGRPFPRPPDHVPLRRGFSAIACLPDDMRGVARFAHTHDWHFADAHCVELDASESPRRCPPRRTNASLSSPAPSANGNGRKPPRVGLLIPALHNLTARLRRAAQSGELERGSPQSAHDLAFAMHLIADATQPLHSCSAGGSVFARGDGAADDDDGLVDEADDASDGELGAAFRPVVAAGIATDAGGNLWCTQRPPRWGTADSGKRRRQRKGRRCKYSLHRFYDDVGGVVDDDNELRDIVAGRGGGPACAAECGDDAKGDGECCLERVAKQLMSYATESNSPLYFEQLKDETIDPARWVLADEALCRATRRDKIRRGGGAAAAAAAGAAGVETGDREWVDGADLVPGEALPAEYVAWARDMLRKRIVLAGFRLGMFLQSLYDSRKGIS
jgi:hypothetical protein